MLFTTFAFTSLLALISAAPTPAPVEASVEKRFPPAPHTILPDYLSWYNVSTGEIKWNKPTGLVQKKTTDSNDITTLVTFTIPQAAVGKPASLRFWLDPADPAASVSGTSLVDLFSSLQPAPHHDVPAWGPPGNQRDGHLARFIVGEGGEAIFSTDAPNKATLEFPSAGKYGFELVGAGQDVQVKWTKGVSGLFITW